MEDVTRLYRKGLIVVYAPVVVPYEEVADISDCDLEFHPPIEGLPESALGICIHLKSPDPSIRFVCADEEVKKELMTEFQKIITRSKLRVIHHQESEER